MRRFSALGFTLIELVIVIVITGILLTVAMRLGVTIIQTSKLEETKQELEVLAYAIAGNPGLQTNGMRSDFGYIGDVGALPLNLDALVTNPGGYSTWQGPYVSSRFVQSTNDYKTDAWGTAYSYSGTAVTSTGSGSNIVRSFGNAVSDFTLNKVSGIVYDRDGTPPGGSASVSIDVKLTTPNGVGSTITRSRHPDAGGYFIFDSIPVGNQNVAVTYTGHSDTLKKIVSVTPKSTPYIECRFSSNYWTDDSTLTLVPGSDSVSGSPACTDISFWLVNNTGSSRTVNAMTVTWASPTAYYKKLLWNNLTVFDLGGSPRGASGVSYALNAPQTILDGQKAKVTVQEFRENNSPGGGNPVSMSNSVVTVRLSDGTGFTEVMPVCN